MSKAISILTHIGFISYAATLTMSQVYPPNKSRLVDSSMMLVDKNEYDPLKKNLTGNLFLNLLFS